MSSLHTTIKRDAAAIRCLHEAVRRSFALRDSGAGGLATWQNACNAFHERYDALAFPGGESSAKARIAGGDAEAIEAALCFLEVRPYFFRSGYMYKDFMRWLKRAWLTRAQMERYERVSVAYSEWKQSRRRAAAT